MNETQVNCDKIYIRDLSVRCIIGVNDEERRDKQDVTINATLYTDLKKAGQTDCLEDSVDYKNVKKDILSLVENSSFALIEKLAQGIADICLGHSKVQRADITVDKPGALRFTRSVAVEIIRTRETDGTGK